MADDEGPRLTVQQIQQLADAIARVQRRRRIQLAGYLLALVIMLVGLPASLYVVGVAEPGEFRGWVYFIPFALVGFVLWTFGRWARRA